jgi:hypothetical protein
MLCFKQEQVAFALQLKHCTPELARQLQPPLPPPAPHLLFKAT